MGRFDAWLLAGDHEFDRRISPFTRKESHSLAECEKMALHLFVVTFPGVVPQVVDRNLVDDFRCENEPDRRQLFGFDFQNRFSH
ncbi:MAG TPA: hypothetical protein VG055_28525 [Planctomycetaceae bacterium]|nr:hypothetical protein [Planctomycetaceae bacterium]